MSTVLNETGLAGWENGGLTLTAAPDRTTADGIIVVTAELPGDEWGDFKATWAVEGPTRLSDQDERLVLLGLTTVTADNVELRNEVKWIRATLVAGPLTLGAWRVGLHLEQIDGGGGTISATSHSDYDGVLTGVSNVFTVGPKPFAAGDDVSVTMKRAAVAPTSDQALWVAIRNSTEALSFDSYSDFLETVLCGNGTGSGLGTAHGSGPKSRIALPFPNVDQYRLLKATTEVFLMTHCGVDLDDFSGVDLDEESKRLNRELEVGDLEDQMRRYLVPVAGDGEDIDVLPYLGLIRRQLRDVAVIGGDDDDHATEICYGILAEKLTHPCFLELIHEYWLDEANVVRAINSVNRRFQNRMPKRPGRDPLSSLDVDPLRPLNALLWGLVQDQQHRLTTVRRAYEYDHAYGLVLSTKPGPPVRGADSRSRFMQAFHTLLSLCSDFYTHDDNTTVIADGFGVLNALKETHLLLHRGRAQRVREPPVDRASRDAHVPVDPLAAGDVELPADAHDGRLPGVLDRVRGGHEPDPGLVGHPDPALRRPRDVR